MSTAVPLCLMVAATTARADTAPAATAAASCAGSRDSSDGLTEVMVTAQRLELLGTATTASEGVVTGEELQLLPAYRPGQLMGTVPGLIVTSRSGEGKSNQ